LKDDFVVGLDTKTCRYFLALLRKFLKPREFQVLEWHFGLTGDGVILAFIAEALGISRERVRQIEESVIRKLGSPLRSRNQVFQMFLWHKTRLIRRIRELQEENRSLKARLTSKLDLATPLSETGLSNRTLNRLYSAGIYNVAELIQKTEEGLYLINGIGRKILSDIKLFLEDNGLALRSK
jgi:DNA-binding CsgD family transcriptional regulator